MAQETYRINGHVIDRQTREGVAGLRVEAWDKDLIFDDMVGGDTTDAQGAFHISFDASYFSEIFFDREPDLFFKVFRNGELIKSTEDEVLWNVEAGGIPIAIEVESANSDAPPTYIVHGNVVSGSRAGVSGLRVEIVDKNVGGDVHLAQAVTGDDGSYTVSFPVPGLQQRGKQRPDLQARVFLGEVFLGASEVRYNGSESEILHVALTELASSVLPSEYETLLAALSKYFKGNLRDLKETADQQDITFLANKTGWDARAVALAALADRFGAESASVKGGAAIHPAFFYALFRAGLPTNPDTLYLTDSGSVEQLWQQAITQGVISGALEKEAPAAIEAFRRLGVKSLLTGQAQVGASSLQEMLAASRLDDAQQQKFTELYAQHRADMPTFWAAIGEVFGEDKTKRLQVDGKLGFLTINNAPLMHKLHGMMGESGISDPVQMAQAGYHRAETWTELIADIQIPQEIPGDTTEEKRGNYADYLAAQVRLSYPSAAVAEMVGRGATPLSDSKNEALRSRVQQFLSNHQDEFEIGTQHIDQYAAAKKLAIDEDVKREITRINRVYQITPHDDAMNALLEQGLDSSLKIARYDRDEFVLAYKDKVGGEADALLIYNRAQQVHNAVVNITVSYLAASNAPGIGVNSPPRYVNPLPAPANANDMIDLPTLEKLLGEMDYCECDQCRSILSPAAYLVDLLHFLDREPQEWKGFLAKWVYDHNDAPYPFEDMAASDQFTTDHPGQVFPDSVPLEVLLSRRPDIQHLPLTCENTNTVLPYIDLVNEVLEFYIANKLSLTAPKATEPNPLNQEEYAGYDTGGVSSEDLLASPQCVNDSVSTAAYTALRQAPFPLPLPFHQPLENLRLYFDKFEVPLSLAMECLRTSDNLERPIPADQNRPVEYGWRDILMEELGLSRVEHAILTDSATATGQLLADLFGYPPGTTNANIINGNPNAKIEPLSNAKHFCNCVGITYEDIVAILQTRFINPSIDLIPKLEQLGVSFAMLDELHGSPRTGPGWFDLLPRPLPEPSGYGDDIEGWVKNQGNYDRIMGLITLTDPTGKNDVNSFKLLELCYAKPVSVGGNATHLGEDDFVRLLRFIRLWKKLGWTIEQTDKAITALYPSDPAGTTDVEKLDDGFKTLLLRLGVIKRVMDVLELTPDKDLLPLLACFAPIDIHGAGSLYRRMFLNPTILKQDAIFKRNDYGEFLTDTTMKIADHAEALRSAFNLTSQEFVQIADMLQFTLSLAVSYMHPQPTLEQEIQKAAPGIGYDGLSHLLYPGSLSTTARDALKAVAGMSQQFKDAVDALFAANSTLTPLTLPNISAIYRHGWLARKLKLSVREFLLLIECTGLNPIAAPDRAYPSGALSSTDPTNTPPILRFIELVNSLHNASLKPAEALYLIWNQDISCKSAPDQAQLAELARTLRGDFAGINDQFSVVEDANGDVARARMTLVYGQETSDAFFALLDDTLIVDVAYTHTMPTLEDAVTAADARITYDGQRLSHKGLMTTAMQSALRSVAGVSADFLKHVDALYERSEDVKGSFFTRNAELKQFYDGVLALDSTLSLHVEYTHSATVLDPAITAADNRIHYDNINRQLSYSGLLTVARRDILKSVSGVTSELQSAIDALFVASQAARGGVLATLKPELARRRKCQQALQRVCAAAGVELAFTQTILDSVSTQYPLHAANDLSKSALEDALSLETAGLAAQFFFRETATGAVDQTFPAVATLDYANGGSNPFPNPGHVISGIWNGQIETPESGFYNLVIETDNAAAVTLTFDGSVYNEQNGKLVRNGNVLRNSNTIELEAGALFNIELKVEKVKDLLSIKWETPKRAREVLPSRYLYPPTIIQPFIDGYIRFLKAASLAEGLRVTANELAYFATYQANGDSWLNSLPNADNLHLTNSGAAAAARTLNAELLTHLCELLSFSRLKADLSPGDERLLSVLKDPAATTTSAGRLLLSLTRWEQSSLDALLTRFNGTSALHDLDTFVRVYDAFVLLKKVGISAKALISATTNEPDGECVRALQAALRARYSESDWRDVVKPINDKMRAMQRDALVAYILHQMRSYSESAHIDTPDKLFEYFLMDVQMEPCMQTSRIRHALSSVQLFIDRCLMNLEPRVAPISINAKQWEWMKRYRVWEANRKVILYPENWLEPELRDNQSPFFKETMSELLQSDITEESAATALLNYLSKLEEVAKLEPCGIYHVEEGDIDHVVARTSGAHRKYYYRRREASGWTPWEHIKLDIEDNPVIPVVWNDRLFLFWLRIVKKGGETIDTSKANTENSKLTVQAILCWSEYYNGKWQATKTSDINSPLAVGDFGATDFNRTQLILRSSKDISGELLIHVGYLGRWSYFKLYNTHSLPLRLEDDEFMTLAQSIEAEIHRDLPSLSSLDLARSRAVSLLLRVLVWAIEDIRVGKLCTLHEIVPSIVNQFFSVVISSDPGYSNSQRPLSMIAARLPEILPRILRPYLSRQRRVECKDHILLTAYLDPDLSGGNWDPEKNLLNNAVLPTIVEPRHKVDDIFEAPFFYEDSRHVFYVTTEEAPKWIGPYLGYGVLDIPNVVRTLEIPSLIVQNDLFSQPAPLPAPTIFRGAAENTNTRFGIDAMKSVQYGGQDIGLSGASRTTK